MLRCKDAQRLATFNSLIVLLHFAQNVHWSRASLSACVSVPHRIPTLLHGPRRNLAEW